jgi:S1-C subfamily serine protease
MTSPEASPPRPRPRRSLRGLAAAAALVVGAGLIGFTTTQAGAQPTQNPRPNQNGIATKVAPSVVEITTTLAGGQGQAAGTGMVLTSSGVVLTNNHVIESAGQIRARIGGAGSTHSARILGYNVKEDVALLKVDGVSNLKTVATDTTPTVGEPVVAVGNGGGRGATSDVSSGSITALGDSITVSDVTGGGQRLTNLIRIDAPLQPGDSGGPLLDANGDVIGMNTAASSGGFRLRSSSSEGFAVPIKTALTVADQIQSGQGGGETHVGERAFIGVSIQGGSASGSTRGGGSGSAPTVAGVQSGSPAQRAGIDQGSVITSVAGKSVSSVDEIASALAPYHPGDKVDVSWTDSSGHRHTANVTLASGQSG